MGEAKRKRELHRELRSGAYPCIYCGGNTPGTTVDHMPPRIIFDNRQRPNDLVFPSCHECQTASKSAEQLSGLMSRIKGLSDEDRDPEELRRLVRAVDNNFPGLFDEMLPTQRQRRRAQALALEHGFTGGALNADGPIVTKNMNAFAAKLGLALHYHVTGGLLGGVIVPPDGVVAVRWFSNVDALEGKIPSSLLEVLGEPETLRQGRLHTAGQFEYAWAVTDDREHSAHFATFRFSFAVSALVSSNAANFDVAPQKNCFRPGFLKRL